MNAKKTKACYVVSERADGKTFWTRIGTATVNADGSLSVNLQSVPVGKPFQIRDVPELHAVASVPVGEPFQIGDKPKR